MIPQVLLLAVFLHGCSAQLLPNIDCDLNVSSSVSTGSVGYHVEGDFESGRDGASYYIPGKTYTCKWIHAMLNKITAEKTRSIFALSIFFCLLQGLGHWHND